MSCDLCEKFGIVCKEDFVDKLFKLRKAIYNGESFPIDIPINECPAITEEMTPKEIASTLKSNINNYVLSRALRKQ